MNLLRGKSGERGNVVSESERQCGVRSVKVIGEWGSELVRGVRLSVMGERVRAELWLMHCVYKNFAQKNSSLYDSRSMCYKKVFPEANRVLKTWFLLCKNWGFKTWDLYGAMCSTQQVQCKCKVSFKEISSF